MSEPDPFGKESHDDFDCHSGIRGHYCPDWDGLYICQDCPEFESCCCTFEAEERKAK